MVKGDDTQKAKGFAEFYTSNVEDISTKEDRKKDNFSIDKIECKINESLEAEEIK